MSSRRVSLVATGAAVLALVWQYHSKSLFGAGPLAIGAQGVAVLLMLWARVTFGRRSFHAAADPTAGGLVTHGPYALVRNPIYAAVILFSWAGVAAHPSLASAAGGAVVAGAMLVRIHAEESFLRARFPEYAAYERRVKRLVPLLF